MKSSSLLTTVVAATVLLTGCFRNSSEGCSSCAHNDDVMTQNMECATCPSPDMVTEQPEMSITIDENAPEMNAIIEDVEEEK